jgi:hypothetical protein
MYFSNKQTTITVTIPRKKMHAILINWSLAKCSCPSWSANTDESALRIALASLDECNSSLHWWLGFWTVLVVIGVALELVFVVWEYIDELHDFRRGIMHPPDRPNRLLFVLGFFATGLVALGVGGELYAESKIATLETCVRKGNDALFLLLSKEAGGAANSAQQAERSSASAKSDAKEAEGVADSAKTTSLEATRDIGTVNTKLDDARTQLQSIEEKRVALEKELTNFAICTAPRVIPLWSWTIGGKTTRIGEELKPFARKVTIEYVPDDAETRRAAANLGTALLKAGWTINSVPKSNIIDGVEVEAFLAPSVVEGKEKALLDAESNSIAAADAVVDFLHSFNWQAQRTLPFDEKGELIQDPKVFPSDSLRIKVGLYPPVSFTSPPALKGLAAEMRKTWEKRRMAANEELRKLRTQEERDRFAKEMEYRRERTLGPCESLNPVPLMQTR